MNPTTADDVEEMTTAERFAYFYQEYGGEAVANLLQILIDPSCAPEEMQKYLAEGNPANLRGFDREHLERDAAELGRMGLPVAELVARAAMDARTEREIMCPYEPEDRANHDRWNAQCDRMHPNG